MKKRIICLLCAGILISTPILTMAMDADTSITDVPLEEIIEDYIDLEEVEIDDIETNSDDIAIIDSVELQTNDDILEVGTSEYDASAIEYIGESSIDTAIVIGDVGIPLYPTFDDKEAVLQNVKNDCPNVLSILAKKYSLEELSEENWLDYYNCMDCYLDEEDKEEWYNDDNNEYIELSQFFDIYENYEVNNNLVSESAMVDNVAELVESETFISNLPSYAVEDLEENNYLDGSGSSDISDDIVANLSHNKSKYKLSMVAYSKSNATAYAKKYATTINKNFGSLLNLRGKDCTNFASQILFAGGKKTNKTWYCVPTLNMYYSPTWCGANKFANYWGVDYNQFVHKNFASKLKAGDFIAYDKTGDGSWDHIGYVTSTKSLYSSSLGYKDYKVAQHSKNYHAWASSSTNGWDKLKSQYRNAKLGIIRI